MACYHSSKHISLLDTMRGLPFPGLANAARPRLPRLRSGFRRAAQTPRKRLNFDKLRAPGERKQGSCYRDASLPHPAKPEPGLSGAPGRSV